MAKKDNKNGLAKVPKMDAFTRIQQYLSGHNIVLTADEENILLRWQVADGHMRKNRMSTDEVCEALQTQFDISKFTALADIRNTQKLFAGARTINKKYVGHLHLERINKDIEDLRERIFFYEKDDMPGIKFPRVPDSKEMMSLARMHEAYTHIFNSLPETERSDAMPPPVFVFNLVAGEIKPTMDLSNALDAADQMISGADYIDHEDLPPDGIDQ